MDPALDERKQEVVCFTDCNQACQRRTPRSERETEVGEVSSALPGGSILSHRCRTGYETADETMKMLKIIIMIITHLFSRKLL